MSHKPKVHQSVNYVTQAKGSPIYKLCHTSQTWKVHQSVNYVTQAKGSTSRKAHVDYDGKTFLSIMQLILIVDLLDIGSYLTSVIYWLVFNTTFSSISAILWHEQILSSIPIKLYIMMLSRKFHWNSILGFF